jgi:hypothetical protein
MADAIDTLVTGQDTYSFLLGRRARYRLRAADTHPPAHFRIKMVHGLPESEASVFLSDAQEERIRAELAGDYARVGSQIGEAMQLAR